MTVPSVNRKDKPAGVGGWFLSGFRFCGCVCTVVRLLALVCPLAQAEAKKSKMTEPNNFADNQQRSHTSTPPEFKPVLQSYEHSISHKHIPERPPTRSRFPRKPRFGE